MQHYILFYKPYQVLSQFSEEGAKKTLAHFFSTLPKDVYPVGRLDYDSEGLLLLTNDKQCTQKLLHPQNAHTKTYWVQVEGIPSLDALKKLEQGVYISINGQKYLTKKAQVQLLNEEPLLPERNPPIRFRKHIPTSWLAISISEGKNRQVRKMTAAIGFPTLRLVRYAIGALTIGSLQPGQYIHLNPQQQKELYLK